MKVSNLIKQLYIIVPDLKQKSFIEQFEFIQQTIEPAYPCHVWEEPDGVDKRNESAFAKLCRILTVWEITKVLEQLQRYS